MTAQETAPYASSTPLKKIRTVHLAEIKKNGGHFSMLTAYDQYTAEIFDAAGIEMLLIGDSAANNVMGYETTLPITMDEMVVFAKAVAAGAKHSFLVCDLPFGSYEISPQQAVESSIRLMKETGIHAVKIECDERHAETVAAIAAAGIPVLAHIGFTPQSEHALGGYRVQGRGEEAAAAMIHTAKTLEEAGAFCVLMEMVPAEVARRVDEALTVPTIGIGAGNGTTGQVLVWQDMLGLRSGRMPKFVKQYAQLRPIIEQAAQAYKTDVASGAFPAPEHSFD
ncbi:3-methyl-2-oxobutanoate hydroxymethyltransferase [Neomicrococcus aestuarii]|uniref:3-methyl-2-oxobutanoate hydroxymethyltransferase n=1 Tax=Neomicrococcus aestuarii TaxID=556325 RepID=A0A1L2ZKM3_9MICC|nr:3-methyl-2-oxobutanoate hydroxymethyltransferase [Neomicrococcus aestuarii]APF39747.1 3-methyl-2-oxobutanoate hydroxymethyltransferase [Neomicrococcus aestuarii]MBB5513772.1 3-methyl-2-oxobutanoate hydroxymethyltransferase [Neomicrococcus aestuarii]